MDNNLEDGRLPVGTGLPMNGAAKASPPAVGIPDAAEVKAVLEKMIKDRLSWAANNQRMLDLLHPEWERFEMRDGHNVYVARIYADHTSSLRKDRKELEALEYALERLCDSDRNGEAVETTGSTEGESAGRNGIAPTSSALSDTEGR